MSKSTPFFLFFPAMVLSILLITSCNSSKFSFGPSHSNVTPTSTLVSLQPEISRGYQVAPDTSCLMGSYTPITTNKAQGDLMAWKPKTRELAYVSPQNTSWSWYLGGLVIVDPAVKKPIYTSSNIRVFGDLSWSPSGTSLALVSLQSGQKEAYSVQVIQPENNQMTDLVPGQAAQTDDYGSQKAVDSWQDDQSLTVVASCGLDCAQALRFNADGTGKQTIQDMRRNESSALSLTFNTPQYDATAFPKMNQPNWSPDQNWIVYVDDDDFTWVINVKAKTQYRLGWLGDFIRETKWSPDSQLLAIRLDNQILVYQTVCQ